MPLGALARLAGWLVVALSLGFLGHRLWQSAPWDLAAAHSAGLALAIGAGTLAYALAGFLLAEAWHRLLGPGAGRAPRRQHHALYGRTQIAKYLPGNCFHFLGRQLLGRRLGHAHGALALASLVETTLLLAVAGALALPLLGPELAGAFSRWSAWPIAAVLAAVFALLVLILRAAGAGRARAGPYPLAALRAMAPRLPVAALLYLAFFAVAGLVLWTIAAATRPPGAPSIDLLRAVSTMALAWWAGFVVPGAAAGLGVREAVLVLGIEPQLGADAAVVVALALRVVTTLGDLLFFALCCLTPAQPETAETGIPSET